MTLTTITLLAPHLTPDNHQQVLEAARHKSKREVEHLVATLRPQSPVPSVIRKVPHRTPDPVHTPASPRPTSSPLTELATLDSSSHSRTSECDVKPAVKPLDAERYKLQFTVTREAFEKLCRVQDLMRHTCPNGDIGVVFERAVTMLFEHLERTKLAQVSRPRELRGTTTRITAYSSSSTTRSVGAGQGTVRLRRDARSMHGARLSGVSSCRAIRGPRNRCSREHSASMSSPQSVRVGPVLWWSGSDGGARASRLFRLAPDSVRTELRRLRRRRAHIADRTVGKAPSCSCLERGIWTSLHQISIAEAAPR